MKTSELDQDRWAIVTATQVICISKTYEQCIMLYEANKLDPNNATIVTNETAERMINNKLSRLQNETV